MKTNWNCVIFQKSPNIERETEWFLRSNPRAPSSVQLKPVQLCAKWNRAGNAWNRWMNRPFFWLEWKAINSYQQEIATVFNNVTMLQTYSITAFILWPYPQVGLLGLARGALTSPREGSRGDVSGFFSWFEDERGVIVCPRSSWKKKQYTQHRGRPREAR